MSSTFGATSSILMALERFLVMSSTAASFRSGGTRDSLAVENEASSMCRVDSSRLSVTITSELSVPGTATRV